MTAYLKNAAKRHKNGLVSGGVNPNVTDIYCDRCRFFDRDRVVYTFGWCENRKNRTGPSPGWPNGFSPSVTIHGTCRLFERAK